MKHLTKALRRVPTSVTVVYIYIYIAVVPVRDRLHNIFVVPMCSVDGLGIFSFFI